jgi:hypothetical protein
VAEEKVVLPPPPVSDLGPGKLSMSGILLPSGLKKSGDPLSDEECDLLGLPHGSAMPDPLPAPIPVREPVETPPFTLDEEELPGQSEPEGSTPAHHTKEHEEEILKTVPENSKTVDQVAAEAKGFFDALLGHGFSRAEALELTKEVVKVRAKE